MCVGMPVMDDQAGEAIAIVSGFFLHPDIGSLEGLFVRSARGDEFLAASDIAHWGKNIVVRNEDALGPLEDRVRLTALWDEGRPVLSQRIMTDAGRRVGACKDVQIDTDSLRLEWLFPRSWFRWGRAIPVSAILEVRVDAIVVRDQATVPVVDEGLTALEPIAGAMPPARG